MDVVKQVFRILLLVIEMVFKGLWALLKGIGKVLNGISQMLAAIWTVELMADVSGMPDWAVAAGLSRREYEYQQEQHQRASSWDQEDDCYEDDNYGYEADYDWHDEGRC